MLFTCDQVHLDARLLCIGETARAHPREPLESVYLHVSTCTLMLASRTLEGLHAHTPESISRAVTYLAVSTCALMLASRALGGLHVHTPVCLSRAFTYLWARAPWCWPLVHWRDCTCTPPSASREPPTPAGRSRSCWRRWSSRSPRPGSCSSQPSGDDSNKQEKKISLVTKYLLVLCLWKSRLNVDRQMTATLCNI